MLRLHALGSLTVERDGAGVPEIAEQHKPLALLALVAVSGEHGVSRDTLAAYLWPDRDAERARGSLSQTVYTLRKQLAEPSLFHGTRTLRLDEAVIGCDLWDLERALGRGDAADAAALYTGPFLHGFFLPGSAELDHWIEEQRSDLKRRVTSAIESLARKADASGDHPAAVGRWRRLLALEPGNSRVAAGLVAALAEGGDRAGALEVAQSHEGFLLAEFDAPPDPVVSALAANIRQPNGSPPRPQSVEVTSRGAAHAGIPASSRLPELPRYAAARRRVVPLAALAGVLVVAAVLTSLAARGGSGGIRPAISERRIAVIAFANETGDTALASIGRIATDWVIQGLVQTQLVDVVGPGVRSGSFPALGDSTPPSPGLIVRGSYSREADSLVVQAQLVEAATGRVVRAVGPISGPLHEPLAVIERLRQQLAGALATRVDGRLSRWSDAASQPTSFEAYRAFDEGLSAFFSLDSTANANAGRVLLRAAALDTTFNLPLLWAVYAFDNVGDSSHVDSVMRVLESRRERLARFDLALFDAHAAYLHGDGVGEYNALRRVVAVAPNSEWLYKLAFAAMNLYYMAEADSLLNALDPDMGWMREWPAYWGLRVDLLYVAGRHDEELSLLSRLKSRFPVSVTGLREGRALAALGRADDVVAMVDDRLGQTPRSIDLEGLLRIVSAARVHGHVQLARVIGERTLRVRQLTRYDSTVSLERYRVLVTEAAGMWEEAARNARELILADSIAHHHDALPYMVLLQAALRKGGNPDTVGLVARALAETAGRTIDGGSIWDSSDSPLAVQAELAALQGDVGRTTTLIREALNHGGRDYFAFSERPAFDGVRADPSLAQLLHNPATDRR